MPESRTSLQESILGGWTLSSYVIADVRQPVPELGRPRCSSRARIIGETLTLDLLEPIHQDSHQRAGTLTCAVMLRSN